MSYEKDGTVLFIYHTTIRGSSQSQYSHATQQQSILGLLYKPSMDDILAEIVRHTCDPPNVMALQSVVASITPRRAEFLQRIQERAAAVNAAGFYTLDEHKLRRAGRLLAPLVNPLTIAIVEKRRAHARVLATAFPELITVVEPGARKFAASDSTWREAPTSALQAACFLAEPAVDVVFMLLDAAPGGVDLVTPDFMEYAAAHLSVADLERLLQRVGVDKLSPACVLAAVETYALWNINYMLQYVPFPPELYEDEEEHPFWRDEGYEDERSPITDCVELGLSRVVKALLNSCKPGAILAALRYNHADVAVLLFDEFVTRAWPDSDIEDFQRELDELTSSAFTSWHCSDAYVTFATMSLAEEFAARLKEGAGNRLAGEGRPLGTRTPPM